MARQKRDIAEKYNSAFATRLRQLIKDRNVTQDAIATHVGVSRQTVSQYVNGLSDPGFETLVKIADYFDVTADYLLGRTDEPSSRPSAVEELGLSTRAIEHILSSKSSPFGHGMRYLFDTSDFWSLVTFFGRFMSEVDGEKMSNDILEQWLSDYKAGKQIIDETTYPPFEEIALNKKTRQQQILERPIYPPSITLHRLQRILNRIAENYAESQGVFLP